ncbi:MAG: TaqI-like C-terminal specificity domain-containing protein [Thermoplasmata archaeon]
MAATKDSFRQELELLVRKFEQDKEYYQTKGYVEAQTRTDFINPFFAALGWDIDNRAMARPHLREVLVEKGDTEGRPDYNFRIDGKTRFYVEAKSPSESLDSTRHILQAKSYAYSSRTVSVVVLTDFADFKAYDASQKPDELHPEAGRIFSIPYQSFVSQLDTLWQFSRDEVGKGSLEKILPKDPRSRNLRIPVDESFLGDISSWRLTLAKDIHRKVPDVGHRLLNDVVQRTLDRLVFLRMCEDRRIIEQRTLYEIVATWRGQGKRKPIQLLLNQLYRQVNEDLNGEVFKPHACEEERFWVDSEILAKIIENLYFPRSPYRFDVIGVELLGSIYERYLGKTLVQTEKQVRLVEKPEVRKAGGIYYTPGFVVDHIVQWTVGRAIQGMTPERMERFAVLDPACGSGSFLVAAYQTLIDYHVQYYENHPAKAGRSTLFPTLVRDGLQSRLSIEKKAQILKNTIFGVDIDPQAVEITMMSLYIKCLEGEMHLPENRSLLPSLQKNVRCGNSLIGSDFFAENVHSSPEARERINAFDWTSADEGFGRILDGGGFDVVLGNPPYVSVEKIDKGELQYLRAKFPLVNYGRSDLYLFFMNLAMDRTAKSGFFSFIVPDKWLVSDYGEAIRRQLLQNGWLSSIWDLRKERVFADATNSPVVFVIVKGTPVADLQFLAGRDPQLTVSTPVSTFLKFPHSGIRIGLTPEEASLCEKLRAASIHVGNVCYVSYGAQPGDLYKFVFTSASDFLARRLETGHVNLKPRELKPFVRGRNVKRYLIDYGGHLLAYDRQRLHRPAFPELFDTPKIMISEICSGLRAFVDTERYYGNEKVVFCVRIADLDGLDEEIRRDRGIPSIRSLDSNLKSYSLHYICGLLNSKLIGFYFAKVIGDGLNVYPDDVREVPLKSIDFTDTAQRKQHDTITRLSEDLTSLYSQLQKGPPEVGRHDLIAETRKLETELDNQISTLYNLTPAEATLIGQWSETQRDSSENEQ